MPQGPIVRRMREKLWEKCQQQEEQVGPGLEAVQRDVLSEADGKQADRRESIDQSDVGQKGKPGAQIPPNDEVRRAGDPASQCKKIPEERAAGASSPE